MKKRTVAIIQARMGSARFPGKMLAKLGSYPLLEWVLRRVTLAANLDGTILATSSHERDNALAELAGKLGVQVYRGSESDVLGRFVAAAEISRAETVVRICADNPFVDPEEIDRLINFSNTRNCDYACNHLDRLGSRYVDGFGAEILGADLLRQIASRTTEARHREHVTLYLWDHADEYNLMAVPAPDALACPDLSFDVDTPADMVELERLVADGINLGTPAAKIVELALAQNARAGAIR